MPKHVEPDEKTAAAKAAILGASDKDVEEEGFLAKAKTAVTRQIIKLAPSKQYKEPAKREPAKTDTSDPNLAAKQAAASKKQKASDAAILLARAEEKKRPKPKKTYYGD